MTIPQEDPEAHKISNKELRGGSQDTKDLYSTEDTPDKHTTRLHGHNHGFKKKQSQRFNQACKPTISNNRAVG